MALSSVIAADGSIRGKRKAEEEDEMGLPILKPIIASFSSISFSNNQIENSGENTVLEEKNDEGFDNEGCKTPTSEESKIKPLLECPPAPRKPKAVKRKKPATISEEFFFVPPDLESVFFPYRIRPRKKLQWSTTEPAWIGVSSEDKFI